MLMYDPLFPMHSFDIQIINIHFPMSILKKKKFRDKQPKWIDMRRRENSNIENNQTNVHDTRYSTNVHVGQLFWLHLYDMALF